MKIHRQFELDVRNATTHSELATVLQHAIKLEHATLLPYYTAIFSLKKGTNTEVEQHIRWVAMEEMLHMCIVANLINALGQQPIIDSVQMVPTFPGPLPMGVNEDLRISLAAYSPEQARTVFLGIENPEDPIEVDDDAVPDETSHSTIGRFYMRARKKLIELGDPLPVNLRRQVTARKPYTSDELFAITNVDDAVRAIDIIVEQGEGTTSSPLSPTADKMAHYYRFQELAEGRRLVKDDSTDVGWSFTGDKIPYNPDDVWPIQADTRIEDIPEGTDARAKAEEFASLYRVVLRGLHGTFNGAPDQLGQVVEHMKALQSCAVELCAMPFPGKAGVHVGPTWEWR